VIGASQLGMDALALLVANTLQQDIESEKQLTDLVVGVPMDAPTLVFTSARCSGEPRRVA